MSKRKKAVQFILALILSFLAGIPYGATAAPSNAEFAWSDEFSSKHSRWAWEYNAGSGYKRLVQRSDAPTAVEIGIASTSNSSSYSDCSLHEDSPNYTTGILEMRLRTSDDNGLTGKGTRGWGFWDGGGNAAWFWSASPESDSQLKGFRVQVVRNNLFSLNKTLSNVDMRQWHIYRVELRGSGTSFYVDDVQVASTNQRPGNKQRAELWIDNYRVLLSGSGYTTEFQDVPQDQKMSIDWVRYYELTSDLVINRSFEIDENLDSRPDNWNRTNSGSNDKRIAFSGADGSYIYKMGPSSSTSTYKSVNQAINQSGKLNDIWRITLWSRTAQANPSGSIRVRIAFRNSSGTVLSASKTLTELTKGGYQTVSITAPQDYTSMTLYLESSVTQGFVYFDNASLSKP